MRKFHKEKLGEQIATLKEAICELDKLSGNERINLCADIQDFIEAILNYFDTIREDTVYESKVKTKLNKLFDNIYRFSRGECRSEDLNCLVDDIIHCQEEIEVDRLEIVFLCYKASMSDSLESIYFNARSDSRCDVYYIPIPYYDKNPDGSLGQVHYESEGYYDSTYKLVDCNSYDIEQRHPDIIYIMNPYDEYNSVTSVHPDFYSSRLKDLCDLLVYVPYALHDDHGPVYVGGIPGVLFSHKTIVQSENIRQSYINSIMKSVGSVSLSVVENKIIAMGSPKVDKAVLSQRIDFEIPESWQDIISSKGDSPIVVLYNISIASALFLTSRLEPEMYLNKIKTVFNFFKKQKNTLLWCRPHPLLLQSFYSLRPELYTELETILSDYRNSNIGIYDDTPDANRAIAFADIVYGDYSSLNFQSQIAGKPILMQNVRNRMKNLESKEEMEQSIHEFLKGEFNNYYCMIESENTWEVGRFNLAGFIEYFDVLGKYLEEITAKYRLRYVNADGSAGENIHRHMTDLLWNMK